MEKIFIKHVICGWIMIYKEKKCDTFILVPINCEKTVKNMQVRELKLGF